MGFRATVLAEGGAHPLRMNSDGHALSDLPSSAASSVTRCRRCRTSPNQLSLLPLLLLQGILNPYKVVPQAAIAELGG